jgi:hypothetical protein
MTVRAPMHLIDAGASAPEGETGLPIWLDGVNCYSADEIQTGDLAGQRA